MKKTNYLYGIEPIELDGKDYWKALQFKYDESTKLYRRLFLKHDRTDEESHRLFYVGKAQGFTKRLLDERYE